MSDQTTQSGSGFTLTGYHVLAIMLAFFGVIIVVNFTMATMASRTWTGLVVKNSYVASQKFNSELAAATEQKKRGWISDLSYTDGGLKIRILDCRGNVLFPDKLEIQIGRPAFEQRDFTTELKPGRHGIYRSEIDLQPGTWAVQLKGSIAGLPYRRDARITVQRNGKGVVR